MKIRDTYQQGDSTKKVKVDTMLKPTALKLLSIEDKSSLIIPVKKIKQNSPPRKAIVVLPDTVQTAGDTSFYNQEFENIPTRKVESLTTQKQEKKVESLLYRPETNNAINTTWQTILLLVAFGLLGFVKAFNSSRFNQIIKSIFSFHAAEEVVREESVFFHRVNLSLFFLYLIGILLLITSILTFNFSTIISDGFYIKIALFIVAAYVLKFTLTLIISAVFSRADLSPVYTYNTLIYNYLFGVILLPCMALIYYSNISFEIILNFVIIPCFVFTFIFRIFRLFMVGIQNNFFVLYIILYICTLEILPLVVLSKFFIFK